MQVHLRRQICRVNPGFFVVPQNLVEYVDSDEVAAKSSDVYAILGPDPIGIVATQHRR